MKLIASAMLSQLLAIEAERQKTYLEVLAAHDRLKDALQDVSTSLDRAQELLSEASGASGAWRKIVDSLPDET
mgnify:CR=1 FL=1